MNYKNIARLLLVFSVMAQTACGSGDGGGGGGTASYTAGGTLTGLDSGKSVVLHNNSGDDLALSANGSFIFATALSDGAAYNVTVATQPSGWKCTVSNGSGTVSGADITNIAVSCAGPADRFVISGNSDGTLSVFRANSVAGYATAMSYTDVGSGFAVQDMVYDAAHQRLVLITAGNTGNGKKIIVVGFDPATGEARFLDSRDTSGDSSHLALNAAGREAYVASGTSTGQAVDAYAIDDKGVLSPVVTTALTVDPDYIRLNPAGDHLYVVSRSNNQVLIFGVNSDNSLAASPATLNTGSSPTSIGFNKTGTKAYLTLATNSNNFITYDVAADGGLTQASTYTSSNNNVIDQVLSADGAHLYALDSSSNRSIDHYAIDATTGAATYVASTNISFNGSDLTLSHTGDQLYVGHGSDALVSTFTINAGDGSLTPVEWVRAFNNAYAVAAVGGAGPVQPTPTYLLAPDTSGLERFAVANDGMLTLVATENSTGALIDGEVAVDYPHGLLLGAGENTSNADYLTSYQLNLSTGATVPKDALNVTPSSTASFQRIRLDRAGRAMYVLDEDVFSSTTHTTGMLRSYLYSSDGTIDTSGGGYDSDSVGEGPENMTLNPPGSYLYSINSFGDNIYYFKVGYSDAKLTQSGTLTPGGTGLGAGRPLDLQFHPNGRYAYLSLHDDNEIDRWMVNANGSLSNVRRLATGTGTQPGPIAVHPNGKYVYNGESGTNDIVVYAVNASDYSLTKQSVVTTAASPSWLTADPQGRFLLARYTNESVQVFSIDQTTGDLTTVQQISAGSDGGFLPTMTLVSPLQ